MARPFRFFASGNGCGFLIVTCVVSCCFLVMNGALSSAIYTYLLPGPSIGLEVPWYQRPQVEQAIKFVAPVLMLVAQWWLVDLLADLAAKKPSNDGRAP